MPALDFGFGVVIGALVAPFSCFTMFGRLGDNRMLGALMESTSVPSVVLLSLAVELEVARPESLRTSS